MGLKFGADITEAEEAEIMRLLDEDETLRETDSRRRRSPTFPSSSRDEIDDGFAEDSEEDLEEDPNPGYRQSISDRIFPDDDFDKPVKVTQALKKDIRGKVAMTLGLVGAAWSNRDQVCGGILMQSIPDRVDEETDSTVPGLATAIADIVCDSPDMVRWFTTSGKYMKWITLAMTAQPILQVIVGHHITHTVSQETETEKDFSQYGV